MACGGYLLSAENTWPQSEQTWLAVELHGEDMNLPATHVVQVKQADNALPPVVTENVLVGQDWQIALDVAPAVVE